MTKLYKFVIILFCFQISLFLNGQTIGETLADSNAYRQLPDLEFQFKNNKSQGTGSRMPGSILVDQGQLVNYTGQGFGGANVSGLTGNFFGINANTSGGFAIADDIVIPQGQLWNIDSIVFFNYQTGSTTTSTINNVRLQIRKGNQPGSGNIVYGNLTTNVLNATYFTRIYRTLSTNLTATNRPIMASRVIPSSLSLSSGTYWLEHQVNGTLPSGPFSPLRTISTNHQNTGNGYQFNNSWNMILELDSNGNNPLNKGVAFIVYGTITIVPPVAEVNGVGYYSLQDAIDAVLNDGTEVLLKENIVESEIGVSNYSVIIKADGNSCSITNLNIQNGKYVKWIEDTLVVTGTINNNTTGTLINNAAIVNGNFTNTGIYKGTGSFMGNFTNQNQFLPGN